MAQPSDPTQSSVGQSGRIRKALKGLGTAIWAEDHQICSLTDGSFFSMIYILDVYIY